ncbi:MAG TPA: hypothetical protein ENK31_05765 [Nannocystis exedens]|nr:hypothetical protein [Nannocystis exedens]
MSLSEVLGGNRLLFVLELRSAEQEERDGEFLGDGGIGRVRLAACSANVDGAREPPECLVIIDLRHPL